MAGELPSQSYETTVNLHDAKIRRDALTSQIPVDFFIHIYDIQHQEVQEALEEIPTLVYLLGTVENEPQIVTNRQTGETESVRRVLHGSGMFGLTDPDDAKHMARPVHHIFGAARHKEQLQWDLANMTYEQAAAFAAKGYDSHSRFEIHPLLQVDIGVEDHSGRRWRDQEKYYGWKNMYAEGEDSFETTRNLLRLQAAPPEFIKNYLRFENPSYTGQFLKTGFFPNLSDNAATVGDWTFGQEVVDLNTRLQGLIESERAEETFLVRLLSCGKKFADDYEEIFGISITERVNDIPLRPWELKARLAYCASSGTTLKDIFPSFVDQYGDELAA